MTAVGTAIGLRKMDYDRIPQVALLSSAFFVASLVHVPAGPGVSAHLVLNGVTGIILGWAAFPAFLVALLLQAVLFHFGGLTALGVNTFNMAAPAVFCYYLCNAAARGRHAAAAGALAFLAGTLGIGLSGLLTSISLLSTGEAFRQAAWTFIICQTPVMVIEGFVAMGLVGFLRRTRPELLDVAAIREKAVA